MNKISIEGDVAKVFLSETRFALVDVASLPFVEGKTWGLQKRYGKRIGHPEYAKAHIGNRVYAAMHRLILAAPKSLQVDHINRNSLDNRLCNLRFCTNAENVANQGRRVDNTSGQRGVYRSNKSKRRPWVAAVRKSGKTMYERTFPTFEEAQLAYLSQAAIHFGEFANVEVG